MGSFFCFLIWAIASNQYDGPDIAEVELPPIDTSLSDLQFQFYDLLPQDAGSEGTGFYTPDAGTTLLVPTDAASPDASTRIPGVGGPISTQIQSTKAPEANSDATPIPSEFDSTSVSIPNQIRNASSSDQDSIRSSSRDKHRPGYVIQVGSFKNQRTAEKLRANLIIEGYGAHMATVHARDGGSIYRVVVGSYETRKQAIQVLNSLSSRGGPTPLLLEMR